MSTAQATQILVQWAVIFLSLSLQVLLIGALTRGPYRRYPVAFVYSIVLLLTTVMDAAALSDLGARYLQHANYIGQYYRTEALRQILLFAVVVSLVDRAVEEFEDRGQVRILLVALAISALATSLYTHGTAENIRMVGMQVGRDMTFLSVIITLVLWIMLISRRTRDKELLLVTGGLGLQFTGEAIGQSLRQLAVSFNKSDTLLWAGNLMMVGAHLLRLYVWWETFRSKNERPIPRVIEGPQPTQ